MRAAFNIYDDKTPELRTVNGEYRDSFWIICKEDGVVALCSGIAAEHGVIPGVTSAAELISQHDHGSLLDGIRLCCEGGDVSICVSAASNTGYDTVRITGTRRFSSLCAELHFYKSKEEYLAASAFLDERLGRVFDYIGIISAMIGGNVNELLMLEEIPRPIADRLRTISELNNRFIGDKAYAISGLAENDMAEDKICDMATVFDCVCGLFESSDGFPFEAAFEDRTRNGRVICATQPKRFVGIILMAICIAARLSENKNCLAVLTGEGYAATLEVSCKLHRDHKLWGRSEDFDILYRSIPSHPIELLIFEKLTSANEWRAEYSADGKGNFVLRAVLEEKPNPNRFKYRDITLGIPEVFSSFSDYVRRSFSADA